jgi:glyoxylase-like metal-dependent hydrolase (beta-lactamase superfamily II)
VAGQPGPAPTTAATRPAPRHVQPAVRARDARPGGECRYRSGVGWNEVAAGVFHRRYDPLDVSVCVIRGPDGIAVVDTRSSPRQADEIRADLRELGGAPVRWVINTHAHFDHTFGNQRFGPGSDLGAPIYGHLRVPAHLDEYERPGLARRVASGEEPADEWPEVVITPPTELVGDRHVLDLGGRAVHLLHLGRSHTDNDLLVHVPDAAAWLLGDVIEESGPPVYGPDSFPLEWPWTLARLLALLGDSDVLVPGHGRAVGPSFVRDQQAQIAGVADLIRELHAAGVPAGRAAAEGGPRWPLPSGGLEHAITAGYGQLSRADKVR